MVSVVEDTTSLQVGHLLALHVENSDEWPAIAECCHVGVNSVTVRWYRGDYLSAWAPYRIADPKDKRKKIYWEQTVPRNSIILYSFSLTRTKHLNPLTRNLCIYVHMCTKIFSRRLRANRPNITLKLEPTIVS